MTYLLQIYRRNKWATVRYSESRAALTHVWLNDYADRYPRYRIT